MPFEDPNISVFFSSGDSSALAEESVTEELSASRGGPFVLYRCTEGGRIKVLKAIREEQRGNPLFEEMLRKEYEIGRSMSHPNIREYRDYFKHPGLGSCIEMEWVDGCPLEEMLQECRKDQALCDKLVSQLLDAVRFIHLKQAVHRDLKPANILVTHKGRDIKLIDFSLSDSDTHSVLKGGAGTARFASPEQLQARESDMRSDIFSLGVILSEMSGRRSWRKAVAKCTKYDPAKRFQSIDELEKALFHPSRVPLVAGVCTAVAALIVAVALIGGRFYDKQESVGSDTIDSIFRQATDLVEEGLD